MQKFILDQNRVDELVRANRYKINPKTKFISRCIDGRYENSEDLPALSMAGADAGELAIIFATAREYGFEADSKKVFKTLVQVVGGEKNLRFHTDRHSTTASEQARQVLGGCGHIKQMGVDPDAYQMSKDEVEFIRKCAKDSITKGAIEVNLEGDHMEGAALIVSGPWAVQNQHVFQTSSGAKNAQVFVFHKTLVDKRHRELAKKLVENKAVKLFEGCDEEYLYEILSNVTESHLFETAKRLAAGLPIYSVDFKEDGSFKIKEL